MRIGDDIKPRMSAGATEAGGSCVTRQAILEAARSRFLHYGYKKTTIDEIAADANVGKGTVYLHFSSKEDILLTLAREVKRNITAQMEAISSSLATPEDKVRRMMLASIISVYDAAKTFTHGAELVEEILRPKLMQCGHAEREAQIALVAGALAEGVRRGEFSVPGGDVHQSAKQVMLATIAFYPPYVDPCNGDLTCRKDLEARASAMLEFLFHGIRLRNPG